MKERELRALLAEGVAMMEAMLPNVRALGTFDDARNACAPMLCAVSRSSRATNLRERRRILPALEEARAEGDEEAMKMRKTDMKQYVLGFCFGPALRTVVLIKKNRPAWQVGRLNGIGGHIEDGETPLAAMAREFREKTAYRTEIAWVPFGRLQGGGWKVYLFHGCTLHKTFANNSDEGVVSSYSVATILGRRTEDAAPTLANLRYLIPMALNHIGGEDQAAFFDIRECATGMP